jgi:hypothetical protein
MLLSHFTCANCCFIKIKKITTTVLTYIYVLMDEVVTMILRSTGFSGSFSPGFGYFPIGYAVGITSC